LRWTHWSCRSNPRSTNHFNLSPQSRGLPETQRRQPQSLGQPKPMQSVCPEAKSLPSPASSVALVLAHLGRPRSRNGPFRHAALRFPDFGFRHLHVAGYGDGIIRRNRPRVHTLHLLTVTRTQSADVAQSPPAYIQSARPGLDTRQNFQL